jgi:hypothetical protein
MRALFGCGLHPLAERRQALAGPDLTTRDYQDAARLGVPFKIVDGDVSPFRLEVARRFAVINRTAGLPASTPLPAADRRGCGPSLINPRYPASRPEELCSHDGC